MNIPEPASLVSLDGKVAVITGAASGIGRAQAMLFDRAGARVIAVDRDRASLDRLTADGSSAMSAVAGDLSTAEGVEAIASAVRAAAPDVDILCNTAGVLDGYARSLETDGALWDRVFDVNVRAMFLLTNAILPRMIERGAGIVLNMSSVASMIAGGGGAAYTASKHAVVGYTRQLASDYGRKGIRAVAICPGMIETGMTAEVLRNEKRMKAVTSIPAGRTGLPADIAAVWLFLAGRGADFMHGASVVVDGGLTIR
jgi:3-oxoacyl-[acyl-carrier protein] reductase